MLYFKRIAHQHSALPEHNIENNGYYFNENNSGIVRYIVHENNYNTRIIGSYLYM